MSAWTLAKKDLRVYFRDKAGVAVGLGVPIALATVGGEGAGAQTDDPDVERSVRPQSLDGQAHTAALRGGGNLIEAREELLNFPLLQPYTAVADPHQRITVLQLSSDADLQWHILATELDRIVDDV